MRVIDLENINLAMHNEEQFVLRCEEVFHDKISSAAAIILAGKTKKPIVAWTTSSCRWISGRRKPPTGKVPTA